jgi:hypothetical protein
MNARRFDLKREIVSTFSPLAAKGVKETITFSNHTNTINPITREEKGSNNNNNNSNDHSTANNNTKMRFTILPTCTTLAAVAIATLTVSSSDAFTSLSLSSINRQGTASTSTSTTTSLSATVEKVDAPPTTSVFLTAESAKACIDLAGSPVYAYSLEKLQDAANRCLAFPNAYGLTVRYAMKACPNAAILKYFHSRGIHIDASSGYEVKRAMAAGIPADNISLSSQELPGNFEELIALGVKINAWYVLCMPIWVYVCVCVINRIMLWELQ